MGTSSFYSGSRWLTALVAALAINEAAARTQSERAAEMASCQVGEIKTWPDGQDRPVAGKAVRLIYRHEGAPAWFDEALVLGSLQRAATAWSACGIPAEVVGEAASLTDPASVTVVQWNEVQARGNFALADVGQRRLSLSAAMFALLAQRNPRHPGAQTLQTVLSHELGHFFGLMAHSRRCVDVMSYYDNGLGETCFTRHGGPHKGIPGVTEYRAMLPTACDIARCKQVNGFAP